MSYIEDLKTEIDSDPLTRGYAGMSDAEVATDLNTAYRDGDADINTLFSFLLLENTHKLDAGDDTQDRSLWLRIKEISELDTPTTGSVADPWGGGTSVTEIRIIKCKQLYEFFTLAITAGIPLALNDTNFKVYLAGAQAAGCMSTDQETALIALSQNKTTRAAELGFPEVSAPRVSEARSI